jgi:hypothetical protein
MAIPLTPGRPLARSLSIGLSLLLLSASTDQASQLRVDLELVLAVDVSDSMSDRELTLQRQGYVAALSDPETVDAIEAGPLGRIAVVYMEWASPSHQRIIVPWTVIDGRRSAEAFARRLDGAVGNYLESTSISSALAYGALLFAGNGIVSDRRVIDISGDGPNNQGPPVAPMRDRLVRHGITINGLPIVVHRGGLDIPDVEAYYRDCVIGGADAFLIPAQGMQSFGEAVRRKLTREIAGKAPRWRLADLAATHGRPDCLVGERLGGNRK